MPIKSTISSAFEMGVVNHVDATNNVFLHVDLSSQTRYNLTVFVNKLGKSITRLTLKE